MVAPLASGLAFLAVFEQAVAQAEADFEHSAALATLAVLSHAAAQSLPSPACNEATDANAAMVKQKTSFFIRFVFVR